MTRSRTPRRCSTRIRRAACGGAGHPSQVQQVTAQVPAKEAELRTSWESMSADYPVCSRRCRSVSISCRSRGVLPPASRPRPSMVRSLVCSGEPAMGGGAERPASRQSHRGGGKGVGGEGSSQPDALGAEHAGATRAADVVPALRSERPGRYLESGGETRPDVSPQSRMRCLMP
jgi:hypothetical protein